MLMGDSLADGLFDETCSHWEPVTRLYSYDRKLTPLCRLCPYDSGDGARRDSLQQWRRRRHALSLRCSTWWSVQTNTITNWPAFCLLCHSTPLKELEALCICDSCRQRLRRSLRSVLGDAADVVIAFL
jgi:hypothetical protein